MGFIGGLLIGLRAYQAEDLYHFLIQFGVCGSRVIRVQALKSSFGFDKALGINQAMTRLLLVQV